MYQLPFNNSQKLIELGGGENPVIRPNADIRALPTVDIIADFNVQPLPIESNAYDGVYCSYILEHISWRKIRSFVAETSRILKPEGVAVFVIPNTKAQFMWALKHENWDEKISQCVFGDQDYPDNAHKAALSPEYIITVFREAGFSDIIVIPHGEFKTDMIVEAKKAVEIKAEDASTWTPEQRKKAYNKDYFNGGKQVGGYAGEGYWDYPVHWTTTQKVLDRGPESVLEIGCARGFILKRLEDKGIRVKGLEVSDHCILTRAVGDIVNWDITQTPWPVKDKEFDLGLSIATLEHIPEAKIKDVMREFERTCKRGLHGVDFGGKDDGFDKTHCTLKPKEWWDHIVPIGHEVVDKEELEKGPITLPQADDLVKLNIGSYTTMFHHGWINIDVLPVQQFASRYNYIFRQRDVREGLLFTSQSVDLIFASHFLEHLTYREGMEFLKECKRVMKPGATMRLIVPDASRLINSYIENNLTQFDELNEGCSSTNLEAIKLWELLLANHAAIYDAKTLETMLYEAGFKTVQKCKFRQSLSNQMLKETLDMYPTMSLFMDAVK